MVDRWRTVGASLIAAALVVTACGGAPEVREAPAAQPSAAHEQAPQDPEALARQMMNDVAITGQAFDKGTLDVRGKKTARVFLDDDSEKREAYFEPSILMGSPGQEIILTVANRGFIAHTFTIEELGIDFWLQPAHGPGEVGETRKVEVTFPTGSEPYLILCEPHDTGGMTGALVAVSD